MTTKCDQLAGEPVLFVMAASPEYGPALRARISPLMTGVGPVEAALETGLALADLAARGQLPKLVVSLGSAGSARLTQGDIYQAISVSWRDMDASPLGFAPGVVPFLDQPATLPLPHQIPDLPGASLSTGGDIVSGPAYTKITEDMVDMESYAVMRACQRFDLPLIVLRGISDGAAPLEGLSDWTQYLSLIDDRLAKALDQLEDALARGAIQL